MTDALDVPNVLVIHTDEQSCWTLGAYGGELIETPHIDRLAREGAVFRNCFSNSPVCTPSRGCFMTGRYPHAHGAYTNSRALNRDEVTWAHILQRHGYDTAYIGKWHLDEGHNTRDGWITPERSMGFAQCDWMFNGGHWKTMALQADGSIKRSKDVGDESTYTTDVLTRQALAVLEQPRDRPFALMLSIPDPHTPWSVREPYASMFDPEAMPLPPTLDQEDLPDWVRQAETWVPGNVSDPREVRQFVKQAKAAYCGEVKCIDDNVGRLMERLEESGLAANTLVVYTSDHGQLMGEHGLMHKSMLYETDTRIPFIVRWPGEIEAGLDVDRVLSTVDFQPTLLELLGIECCSREQGRSVAPCLRGESVDWEDAAFIHHSSFDRLAIFTPRYELIYVKGHDHALFDRQSDPWQVHNLFRDEGHRDVVRRLSAGLIEHCKEVQAPQGSWLPGEVEAALS